MSPMGLFSRQSEPVRAALGDAPLHCLFCGSDAFWHRQIEIRPSGGGLADHGWANDPADALLCTECGFVHQFHGRDVTVWTGDDD
jgi:hypothetical protein